MRIGLILAVTWGKKGQHPSTMRHCIVAVTCLTEELIQRNKLRDIWEVVYPTEWVEAT